MAMVVKNNMSAVSTLNTLNKNSNALQKSLSKVSSGMKINSAQDDASGYAISERMRVQIRSLDQANQNTQNGSSMMKTAEGAVSSTVEILKSLKEKAINAANDTNKDSDRVTIQKEIDQFIDQIDDNALTTFNGKYLVDGSKAQQGKATFTAMTNQSLSTGTDGGTKLTELKNRNDESLEIRSTDYVTASFVQNGETYTTKFLVGKDTELKDIFNNLNTQYQKEANTTTSIFGAANTEISTTAPMTAAEAQTLLNGNVTTENILKAAKTGAVDTDGMGFSDTEGTEVTVGKFKEAIKTLYNDSTLGGDNFYASVGDADLKLDTAKTNLESAAQTAVDNLETAIESSNFTATGGNIVANESVSVTFSFGTNEVATGTSTVTTTVNANATTPNAVATMDADKIKSLIVDEADAVATTSVTNGTYGTDAVKTAADTLISGVTAGTPVITKDATTPGGATSAPLTGFTAPTVALTADSAGEKYVAAKALATMIPASASAEVYAGTKIGVNASNDMVYTADGTSGLTVTAANDGIKGQVSGLTISITDSDGNVKKSANASLDAFSTTIYAKNASDRNELSFQVGAAANQAIAVGLEDMRSEALGLKGSDGSKVSVATQDKANAAVSVFDNAIQKALDQQTTIGAIEARLEYTSQNLTTSSENVQAAESTIRDADMAKEMTNYTKNNVLLQAAQSMLAQANQSSSAVLSLLQ